MRDELVRSNLLFNATLCLSQISALFELSCRGCLRQWAGLVFCPILLENECSKNRRNDLFELLSPHGVGAARFPIGTLWVRNV